jgi:hypothetical protein
MKHMMLRVAGLMVLFGALSVATARADSRFSIHVGTGAPVVVAPNPYGYDGHYGQAPYPGYVWQPGYYIGHRWVAGRWVPRARYIERRSDRRDWRRYERDRRDRDRDRRDRDRRRW